jgi:iron complex transport system ATP-binding protein
MGIVLSCRNLGFKYDRKRILDEINCEIKSGLFYAILGKNGSGKTTLLHCLNGILKPDRGEVEIGRQNIEDLSRRQIAREVSLVPQEHLEIFPFKVLDVVVMGRAPFLKMTQTPGEDDYQLALEALKILSSEHLADADFNRISGGERQITMLASALVQTSKIMLLDEPTNHLDFNNQYRLLAKIKELCRTRQSCVIATMHDPNLARLYADEIIMLKRGRIIASGRTEEIMTPENINRLYDTRAVEIATVDSKNIFLPESAII